MVTEEKCNCRDGYTHTNTCIYLYIQILKFLFIFLKMRSIIRAWSSFLRKKRNTLKTVTVINLFSLMSKHSLQYTLCNNGQNSLKHASCTMSTLFSFLKRGHWKDIQRRKVLSCYFQWLRSGLVFWVWDHLVELFPRLAPRTYPSFDCLADLF